MLFAKLLPGATERERKGEGERWPRACCDTEDVTGTELAHPADEQGVSGPEHTPRDNGDGCCEDARGLGGGEAEKSPAPTEV